VNVRKIWERKKEESKLSLSWRDLCCSRTITPR